MSLSYKEKNFYLTKAQHLRRKLIISLAIFSISAILKKAPSQCSARDNLLIKVLYPMKKACRFFDVIIIN